jgi:FAD/FMN-containing dehydrogenase/Fe-S oxidoreductase
MPEVLQFHPPSLRNPSRTRASRFGTFDWAKQRRDELEAGLRAEIRGEVRFDPASRALYATAGSNYRQVPIGVIVPRDADDVVAALAVCRRHEAPVLGRGGGTSLAGQCCNVAVVFDFSKSMNRIIQLEPDRRSAFVEPGLILDHLRTAAERHHLTFGPDPSTHDHCTLGGMIGNNSCGVHSVMAGKTDDNVEALDILTYDGVRFRVAETSDAEARRIAAGGGRKGEIYERLLQFRDKYSAAIRSGYPKLPRRVSGYNLPWLLPENGFNIARALVGSEGTCVMVLSAQVRLVHSPSCRTLVVLGYPDIYAAADDVPHVLEYGPIGLEGMDDRLVRDVRHIGIRNDALAQLPEGAGWLLAEFGGSTVEEAEAAARRLIGARRAARMPASNIVSDPAHQEQIWKVREAGLGATAHVTSDHPTWEGWEDSAVPVTQLGPYLRDLRELLNRYDYIGDFYGHFGQGCLHTRINFDLFTEPGIRKFRGFISEAADLVVSHGGSLSGEHGDGQSKAEMLPKMFSAELLQAFREFKAIWDPQNRLNPGKVVDPYRLDENLRYGSDYSPIHVHTHFRFPEERGNFAKAPMRCVGVGECRRTDRGTMCPSFQVTREEMHSTRGRAHLLWEMLEGSPVEHVWQNEQVKEALDLCLACKGCKGDCPVHVDMATYKAEFLSHYFEEHWRPRTAWSFGLIHWWARAASIAPALVNTVTSAPGLSRLAKWIAGMPQERRTPSFALATFQQWARSRATASDEGLLSTHRVVLWPDTFNNHFHPETAIAAHALLREAGFHVIVPSQSVCCGRPLYDYGLLDLARRTLLDVIDTLRDEIRAGVPVVVLEPSCAAVFRDELTNMLPDDEDARRLSAQVRLLGEFVAGHRDRFAIPKIDGRVLYHAHCHQKSIFGTDADAAVLKQAAHAVEAPDTGCCGMAGSFGFEADHYDVSMKVGERVLLPSVRAADPSTTIVADGFSCREQIAQATDRRALHLAEFLRYVQQHGAMPEHAERSVLVDHAHASGTRAAAFAAAALVLAGASWAVSALARLRAPSMFGLADTSAPLKGN